MHFGFFFGVPGPQNECCVPAWWLSHIQVEFLCRFEFFVPILLEPFPSSVEILHYCLLPSPPGQDFGVAVALHTSVRTELRARHGFSPHGGADHLHCWSGDYNREYRPLIIMCLLQSLQVEGGCRSTTQKSRVDERFYLFGLVFLCLHHYLLFKIVIIDKNEKNSD